MNATGKTPAALDQLKPWLLFGAIALAAVGFGLSLPQLLTNDSNPVRAEPPREAPAKTGAPAWPESPELSGLVWRLVFGTVVVLGLCGAVLWFAGKRLQATTPPPAVDGNQLRILSSLHLGNRMFVHLVQAGEQRVVVGTDRSGVQGVAILPEALEEAFKPAPAEAATGGRKIASIKDLFA